jgi:ankyrin repeat protein
MGHLRVVELLLDRGAYVNSLALFRETAVRSAATRGHRKVAELLVDRGALIDRITGFELPYTVEEWALIDADPDADSMENTGWSPLHRAAWAGNKEAVAELLRRGADRKMKDEGGALPLHWAARMGHLKIAELLLNNKTVMEALLQPRGMDSLIQRSRPEVNAPDNRGWTPLHEAVGGGRLEVVAFLIDRGGLIDDPTTVGSTPLHIAAGAGYRNLVQLLIERGAEVNPTATLGRTPLHGARARGHTEIIEYLEEHGGE